MKGKSNLVLLIMTIMLMINTSCSNEDITISGECLVTVKTSTVVANFVEIEPGELTTIPEWCQVRVHLYAYNDKDGILVASDVKYANDYSHMIDFKLNLPVGNYKLITVTDVVSKDGAREYWRFENEGKLTDLTITNTNIVAGPNGILGYGVKELNFMGVGEDCMIEAMPMGSLIFVAASNIKTYPFIQNYQLMTNRKCDVVKFTSNGDVLPSIESSESMDWRMVIFEVDEDPNNVYTYVFTPPVQNQKFEFRGYNDEGYYVMGDSFTTNLGFGDEFDFELDVKTQETIWVNLNLTQTNELETYANSFKPMRDFTRK